MFKLVCGDVMPGCTTSFEHPDRDQMVRRVASHAVADHGVAEVTPAMLVALEGRIAYVL